MDACPGLTRLDLSYNLLDSFKQVAKLKPLKSLTHLSLAGNESLHYEATNGPAAVAAAQAAAVAQAQESGSLPTVDPDEKDPIVIASQQAAYAAAVAAAQASALPTANPMAPGSGVVDDAFVWEVLILLPHLLVLDGVVITVKHRKQADALHKERIAEAARAAEEEKKRIEDERADNPEATDRTFCVLCCVLCALMCTDECDVM